MIEALEFSVFFIVPVLLAVGIGWICFRDPQKLYKIEYKENSDNMPLYSSIIISARSGASAVKKFNRKYGRSYSVQNVIEVREKNE